MLAHPTDHPLAPVVHDDVGEPVLLRLVVLPELALKLRPVPQHAADEVGAQGVGHRLQHPVAMILLLASYLSECCHGLFLGDGPDALLLLLGQDNH